MAPNNQRAAADPKPKINTNRASEEISRNKGIRGFNKISPPVPSRNSMNLSQVLLDVVFSGEAIVAGTSTAQESARVCSCS
jgi:hypothetical protein